MVCRQGDCSLGCWRSTTCGILRSTRFEDRHYEDQETVSRRLLQKEDFRDSLCSSKCRFHMCLRKFYSFVDSTNRTLKLRSIGANLLHSFILPIRSRRLSTHGRCAAAAFHRPLGLFRIASRSNLVTAQARILHAMVPRRWNLDYNRW